MSGVEDGICQVWIALLESVGEAYTRYSGTNNQDVVVNLLATISLHW